MRNLRLMILCLVLVLVAGGLAAAGLTLYSYVDELGQTIVVDSLERIPEQYRDNAKRGFIPTFRSPKPSPKPGAVVERVPDASFEKPPSPIRLDKFQVNAPPDEVEIETGLASASRAMEQLRLIHLNYERLYIVARDNNLQFPLIGHLHLSNGQLIADLAFPGEMSSAAGTAWLKNAHNLYDQLRAMYISITSWLSTNSPELLAAMPMLLTRTKATLAELETSFSAMSTGK